MLDVMVANYRTPDLLKEFLDSYFFQSSVVPTTLTVIDIDPTDETDTLTRDILAAYQSQGHVFSYWPMDYNCGYAGACNFAASLTDGDALVFFNADTKLYDKTLDECYSLLMSDNSYGIVGPMQVNSKGRVTHAGISGTNEKPNLRGWNSAQTHMFGGVDDTMVSVSGSAYFIKRETWDAVEVALRSVLPTAEGAMPPMPLYYEETFVSYVARDLGWKVVYNGDSVMVHEWNKSPDSPSQSKQMKMKSSRATFRHLLSQLGIAHD